MADKDNLGHEAQQEEVTGETSVVEVPEKFRDEEGNLISDKLLKSYAEVEKSASKLAAERADLQRQLEDAKARADLASKLDVIAENTKAKEETQASFEDWVESRKEAWEDDHSLMALDLAKAQAQWSSEDRKKYESQMERELKELKDQLANVNERLVTTSPDYRENEARIKVLTENGMPLSNAIKLAAAEAKLSGPTQPDRETPPSSMPGSRVSGGAPKKTKYLSEDEKASYRSQGFSDAEIESVEKDYARRVERGDKDE